MIAIREGWDIRTIFKQNKAGLKSDLFLFQSRLPQQGRGTHSALLFTNRRIKVEI